MKLFSIAPFVKKDYIRFMNYVTDYLDHPQKEIIEQRLEILNFYEEFGLEATRRPLRKAARPSFSGNRNWLMSGGKLSALAPGDRTPKHRRKRIINPFIAKFIIDYRSNHPGADKTTITPALTSACIQSGVKPVSESTVGRIIHDLKEKGRLPKASQNQAKRGNRQIA